MLEDINFGVTYNITVTNVFVAPDASWCYDFDLQTQKRCSTTPVPTYSTTTITTHYWAPLMISNPASCTKTSFSYTSSKQQYLGQLDEISMADTIMSAEATESAQALFITTYIVTISTNIGGQAVTTNMVDVYLKSDAIQGIQPGNDEASYLNQCVDPSSFLCNTSTPAVGDYGCGPTNPITYPPRSGAVVGGGNPTGSTASPLSTTSKSGAQGLGRAVHLGLLVGVWIVATVLLFG
jgi:hypothetical protein